MNTEKDLSVIAVLTGMVENTCNKILIFGKNAWLLHSLKESIAVFGIVINFRFNEEVSLFEEIVIVLSSLYIIYILVGLFFH